MNKIETLTKIESLINNSLEQAQLPLYILITGKMGVGKTTLIKELTERFNVSETVVSPTFTIVNEYNAKTNDNIEFKIMHADLWRLSEGVRLEDIGLSESELKTQKAVVFIEWPEKLANINLENQTNLEIQVLNEENRDYQFEL